jgi:hypothetical protein
MSDREANQQVSLDHSWRYFALHAEQRVSVFNHFVAFSSILATGLAVAVHESATLWHFGIVAGMLLVALSFVFWKLDERSSELVKLAEDTLSKAEAVSGIPQDQRVVTLERALRTNKNGWRLTIPWTYGRSFRLLFSAMAIVGLGGAGYSAYSGWIVPAPTAASKTTRSTGAAVGRVALGTGPKLAGENSTANSLTAASLTKHRAEAAPGTLHGR